MKKIILFALLVAGFVNAHAQWSNTTNQFYDSLDMPVGLAANDQVNPLIIKSQPDGGYFVIWEDYRTDGAGKADIYAQKYDKDGNALWVVNGVPVASGPTSQLYSASSNGFSSLSDYRNVSHAVSDGSGGFFIAWADQVRIGSYDYSRVCAQHMLSNGSPVYGSTGYIIGNPDPAISTEFSSPQLIADGRNGFFIGYARGSLGQSQTAMSVWVYAYREEGGTLKNYGGDQMNDYGVQLSANAQCGTYYTIAFPTPSSVYASSFVIFPDLQDGCGVAMTQQINTQQNTIGFNRLCRVKKDCHTVVYRRSNDVAVPIRLEQSYKEDSVVRLYSRANYSYSVSCSPDPLHPQNIVVYTNFLIDNNGQGFEPLIQPANLYGVESINAKMFATDGNIDACLITWNQRDYISATGQVTNWQTRSFTKRLEKFDSLPYELCSDDLSHAYQAYRPTLPDGATALNWLNTSYFTDPANPAMQPLDTLISNNNLVSYGYTLAASGNKAFLAASSNLSATAYPTCYQEISLNRTGADTFLLKLNTPTQNGIVLGYGLTSTQYSRPLFATDGNGHAVFYIGEYHSYLHVSPVAESGKLLWGTMGIPISAAIWNGHGTTPDVPFMVMDADGKAVIAWQDERETPIGYLGNNIYMRHLDSLTLADYLPPIRKPQALGTSTSTSIPQILNGTSNAWTPLMTSVYNPALGVVDYSAPVEIKDDYNLGTVTAKTYTNTGAIRTTTEGTPYLNRNYTISVTNHPAGATIHVRLIFTKAEFDALKSADPAIQTPGDLSVIKQSNPGGTLPSTYTPVAGELGLKPIAWAAIDTNGYYIEVVISDFSNFFIMRNAAVLPITLSNFTAKAISKSALLQWETASEINNSYFDIQRSPDGRIFKSIGQVAGSGTTDNSQWYSFTDAAPFTGTNYYRLVQVDLDGNKTISATRLLNFSNQPASKIIVAPNPVLATLQVKLPRQATGQYQATVYDMGGRIVMQQTVNAGSLNISMDVSTLLPGSYILHYADERVKIIKVKQ